MDEFYDWLEQFQAAAYDAGFDANGESIDTLHATAIASEWEYGEPEISFSLELGSDGEDKEYTVLPTVKFPILNCADIPYYDSVEWYCGLFADRIGGFCKWLMQNPCKIHDYEPEYDEEY